MAVPLQDGYEIIRKLIDDFDHRTGARLGPPPDAAWRAAMEAAKKAVAALTAENEKLRAENERLMAARPGDTKLRTDRERQCYCIGYDQARSALGCEACAAGVCSAHR